MDGRWLILLAALLWGTTGTSQALAPAQATPLAIGALRLLVGGGALLLVAIVGGQLRLERRWLQWPTLFSGLSVAVYQLTFFAAISRTGVAVGTLLAIGSAPVFAGVLGRVVRGEALNPRWYVATALAVIGCSALVGAGNDTLYIDPSGVLLALCAGLSYAVFALVNKQLVDTFPSTAVMAVAFSTGALLLLPILAFVELGWVSTVGGAVVVLHLGLLATGLSYFLFGHGLRSTSIAAAGTLSLMEPLTATVLGVLVVGEQLNLAAFTGIAILLLGLVILIIEPRHPKQAA